MRVAVFGIGGRFPDILWDGYVNADKTDDDGNLLPEYAICVENGDVDVLNVDLPNGSANIVIGSDQHNCQQNKLTAVELSTAGP